MASGTRTAQLKNRLLSPLSQIEAVPLAALVLGGFFSYFPFFYAKENRVVDGVPLSLKELWDLPFIAALTFLVLLVLTGSFLGRQRGGIWRRGLYLAAGVLAFWLPLLLLVRGREGLPAGGRLSPALGFWGGPLVCYMLLDYVRVPPGRGRRFLLALVLLVPPFLFLSQSPLGHLALVQEWAARRGRFPGEVWAHGRLFLTATGAAVLAGVPLGILSRRSLRLEHFLITFVDTIQTLPSLALFGLLMGPLALISQRFPLLRSWGIRGIGSAPALIALGLYALFPILRNTVLGLSSVSPAVMEAGRGLGMSSRQLFWQVRWPLASPLILTGIRTAAVQGVGNAAVASLIGAGGLGVLIFQGLGQAAPDLVILGVFPLVLMAVVVDRFMGFLMRVLVPPGLRLEETT